MLSDWGFGLSYRDIEIIAINMHKILEKITENLVESQNSHTQE